MGAENTLCLDLGFNNVTPADNIVVFPEWRWARTSDSIDDESRFRENLMTILNDSSLEHVRQQLDQGRVAPTSSTTIRLLTQLQDVDLLAFYKSCRFDFKVTCYSSDEACWWEAIEHIEPEISAEDAPPLPLPRAEMQRQVRLYLASGGLFRAEPFNIDIPARG